ncbi:tyrosine-type recombinase/integrase [Candidatus Liberibacter sp.]|uniref:tyrosine-type recombinase/integrase n=1 Tax=Candidatus Liberibacter sp. TaxID=34022 RepID=UPI0015F5D635|nr:tyrosine-type recombinase/integrase [Candidatus Liberibacter sp.]MBA5724405.1 tyrosine-type recombinase/integrase [Candidatus Liberibacter sp.]
MKKTRYPHLSHETTRHGRKVWYFKKDGKRVRLPDTYGTEEFIEAYSDALAGRIVQKGDQGSKGTFKWLIDQYRLSGHYQSLNTTTKRVRDNLFLRIIKDSGDIPYAKITRRHMQNAVDRRSDKPSVAVSFLKAVSPVFRWAETCELITNNPVVGIRRPTHKTIEMHAWSVEQVAIYRKHHPINTMARLALELMLFLGLRRSDVIRIGKKHVKDSVLSIRTQKTGKQVHVPIFEDLQTCLDAVGQDGDTFLLTSNGKSFSSFASFGNWFRERCKEAGLPEECRAHGLRKAGATIAANAGASPHELMAMYGWSKTNMAELYTREFNAKKLAYKTAKMIADNT